jgi:hypothetical protein
MSKVGGIGEKVMSSKIHPALMNPSQRAAYEELREAKAWRDYRSEVDAMSPKQRAKLPNHPGYPPGVLSSKQADEIRDGLREVIEHLRDCIELVGTDRYRPLDREMGIAAHQLLEMSKKLNRTIPGL